MIYCFDDRAYERAGHRLVWIELAEAVAAEGEQGLHVWDPRGWKGPAPRVFRDARAWAHLFDQDRDRLEQTAKRLGVRVLAVGRPGEVGQHIDLCAGPLERAIAEARPVPPRPPEQLDLVLAVRTAAREAYDNTIRGEARTLIAAARSAS